MFSDKHYSLKLGITLAIVLGACLYSALTLRFSEDPSGADNIVCKYRKVSEVGDNYLTYGSSNKTTTVHGNVSGIKKGDYVSFIATMLDEKNLKLKSFHIHKYRIYAIYFSVPPVIAVFWIAVKRLKWSKKGLSLRP